jgi:hypothetical protein
MTKDQEHPFLRPLWRRVVLVAFCAVWAIWEVAYNREAFWSTLAVGMAIYAAWTFLVSYPKPDNQKKE